MTLKKKILNDNLYTTSYKNLKSSSMLYDFYARAKENKKGNNKMKIENTHYVIMKVGNVEIGHEEVEN